jgi:hypothetical protein
MIEETVFKMADSTSAKTLAVSKYPPVAEIGHLMGDDLRAELSKMFPRFHFVVLNKRIIAGAIKSELEGI